MKYIKQIIIVLLLFVFASSLCLAQKQKDTTAIKKHRFSISLLNELNYSNDTKIIFQDNLWEHSGYSYSGGVTINCTLSNFFSIGSGLMIDQYSILYYTVYPYGSQPRYQQQKFFFIGIPVMPNISYKWKRISFHFIPEIRTDIFMGVKTGTMRFNNNILFLAIPKFGISYKISNPFSISVYLGVKYSLSKMKNTHYNTPWSGDKLTIYSLIGSIGINYTF